MSATSPTPRRLPPAGRIALLTVGYVVGLVLAVGGGIAFSSTGDMDAIMSRGIVMVAGLLILYGTHEAQVATRPRKPDPIESTAP